MSELELVSKGPSICWPGDYHYLEPWVGCDNNCYFCFARQRDTVKKRLKEMNTSFDKPLPFHEPDRLLVEIRKAMDNQDIKMIRPSRFTDLFSGSFVQSGLAYEVLKTLCDSKVPEIAICTKGVPDSKILDLIIQEKGRVRYYANIKPETGRLFEPDTPPYKERIEAVAYLAKNMDPIRTAVHIDPLVIGVDTLPAIEAHLRELKKHHLTRIMFSFLMLNDDLIQSLSTVINHDQVSEILQYYDASAHQRQILKNESDTTYFFPKKEIEKQMVSQIMVIMEKLNFQYIICYQKNLEVYKDLKLLKKNTCWQGFYQ